MKKLTAFALLATLAGCTTLKKCEKKFSRVLTDTVTVKKEVVVTIPRDSAIIRITTDTTRIVRQITQGRATVRIVREPHFTTVYASCDSARIVKEAILKVPKNTIIMGVNTFWKWGFWFVLFLLLVGIGTFWLSRLFTVQITKK